MIKISYDEPLSCGSPILFNINEYRIEAEITKSISRGNYYLLFKDPNPITLIEKEIGTNIKDFFSKILRTNKEKYKSQYWPEEPLENLKKVLRAMETEVKGVEFEKPLRNRSKVTFLLPKGIINSHVNSSNQKTGFIWIEDVITPDQLMITLCGETIKTVYSNAGTTTTSLGSWPCSTLEDLEKVLDYINEKCHYNVQKPINNPIKQQQNGNEIKLQRTKGIIRSGKVQKDVEYAVKSTKLQYQADLLKTQQFLDEAKKNLAEAKTEYPMSFEKVVNLYNEVESYEKGLTVLKEIGKELGFE